MPGKPDIVDFPGFFCFRGLGGTSRHQPASYCGDHIVPYQRLCEPEMYDHYISVDSNGVPTDVDRVPNPQYVGGTERKVLELLNNFLPSSQTIQLADICFGVLQRKTDIKSNHILFHSAVASLNASNSVRNVNFTSTCLFG